MFISPPLGTLSLSCVTLDTTLISDECRKRDAIHRKSLSVLNKISSELKSKERIVEIEPLSYPSQLDNRVLVSDFMWAVTLITYEGSLENHAKICFESIRNGVYFCDSGHFTGRRVEFTTLRSDEKVELTTRSEIWMRKSEEVQEVINLIQREDQENVKIKFTLLGNKSVITTDIGLGIIKDLRGGDTNCCDWVQEKLFLLNIELEENPINRAVKYQYEKIAAAARLYTREPGYYLDKPVNVSI